jgi:hypothetical protein
MELLFSKGICTTCTGVEECNKYCALHAAKALIDFISRVDMIETRIGEYSSTEKEGVQDLVVSGHQIWELGSPSWLLTKIGITLDTTPKFNSVYDKNTTQLILAYGNKLGIAKDEINEVVSKIQKLNKNKLIVLPFKPHTSFKIDAEYNGKVNRKEAELSYLKWTTNKETFKLECTIGFKTTGSNGEGNFKFNVKDYIDKFVLSSSELHAKNDTYDKNLIKITDYGIFKPILVDDGSTKVAIDGSYLYMINSRDIKIIGHWDTNGKLVVHSNSKSAALKKIKDNETYIRNHKKYMAPYLLYEPNIVEV